MERRDILVYTSEIVRVDPLYKGQPRFCCGEPVRLKDGREAIFHAHKLGVGGMSIVTVRED